MQMSSEGSWQAENFMKGNHRRTLYAGMYMMWGFREYLIHSFERRGAIIYRSVNRM